MSDHDDNLQDLEPDEATTAEVTGGNAVPPPGRLVSPEVQTGEIDPGSVHTDTPDGVSYDNGKVGLEAGRRERGVGGSARVGDTEQEFGTGN